MIEFIVQFTSTEVRPGYIGTPKDPRCMYQDAEGRGEAGIEIRRLLAEKGLIRVGRPYKVTLQEIDAGDGPWNS